MKAKNKLNPKAEQTRTISGIVGVGILAGIAALLTYAFSGSDKPQAGAPTGSFLAPEAVAAETAPTAAAGRQIAAALQRAASADKTLFAFIFEGNDEATSAARKGFENTLAKLGDQVQCTMLDRTAPSEKGFVSKYGLDRAPMPMVLAVAPNGAITGGFPAAQATEQRLRDALASPGMQECLKALQERRLVMVCLQNSRTQANEEAMKGVNDFKANSQFGSVTDIVKVDPSDPREAKLLGQLQANPAANTATTAFLAPPGVLVAKVEGPTTKEALAASLQKAMASCAPGSGCCPAPKK
jgi:hypothetical protein